MSRELALQALYAREIREGEEFGAVFDTVVETARSDPGVRTYARRLCDICLDNSELLDTTIREHAANWTMTRMSAIDRNILRLGAAELILLRDEVPPKVAIDEAVEIAKIYGADDSAKFVNGVLDAILRSPGDCNERKD